MEKLNFKLTINNKTLIKKDINYYIEDNNQINFSYDNNIYKILIKEKILNKSNKESNIKLDFIKKIAIINELEHNLNIDIEMLKSSCYIEKKLIEFMYTLNDGENNKVYIRIKY